MMSGLFSDPITDRQRIHADFSYRWSRCVTDRKVIAAIPAAGTREESRQEFTLVKAGSQGVRLANQPPNRIQESSIVLIRDPKLSWPDCRGHVACRCLSIRWLARRCRDPVGGRKCGHATYRVVQETVGQLILQHTND